MRITYLFFKFTKPTNQLILSLLHVYGWGGNLSKAAPATCFPTCCCAPCLDNELVETTNPNKLLCKLPLLWILIAVIEKSLIQV